MNILISFLFYFSLGSFASEKYWMGDFLSLKEAQNKSWGNTEFDPEKFKSLDIATRKAMAVNALVEQSFVGKDILEVRKIMGDPNSYFFSDTIYAYQITPPKKNTESWHLLFIPDKKLKNVKEVRIHKRCCYKEPKLPL